MPVDFVKGSVTLDFAQVAAGGGPAVETFERDHVEDLAGGASYTPADEGLFSASMEDDECTPELLTDEPVWESLINHVLGISCLIGDGTNLRFTNDGGALNIVVMRHHVSTGTYERYYTANLGAGSTYTPADEGLFSMAPASTYIDTFYQYAGGNWDEWYDYDDTGGGRGTALAIGDSANLRYRNSDGSAHWFAVMRAVMA